MRSRTDQGDRGAPRIRLATPADAARLPRIERSAGRAFLGTAQAAVAAGPVSPARWYGPFIARGLVWVAELAGPPAGFAAAEPFDDALHLWELAVRRPDQGRGLGRALVAAVTAEARGRRLPAVTLTTFRHIPWNGPFYARLGFVELVWNASPRLPPSGRGRRTWASTWRRGGRCGWRCGREDASPA